MLKFFGYDKCSTCRNAQKWLDAHDVTYEKIDITQTPPTKVTLKKILTGGQYKLGDLFNRSGQLYREMGMKDRVKELTEDEALSLLAEHGKLVKRPIVVGDKQATVGFKEDVYDATWR